MSLFAISVLTSCAGTKTNLPKSPTAVYLDEENQLRYEGVLDSDSNELLFSLFEQATLKPDTLVITSSGGDVMLGMDIGNWIYDNNLNVIVKKACMSSCANYIFTAGKRKGLYKNSIVGWHGSSWQKSMDRLYQQGNEWIIAIREREVSFFKKIGVDHRITIYGFSQYTFWDHLGIFVSGRPIQGFDFSIEDMAKFGVTNVHLIDGEWSWREYNRGVNAKRVVVKDDAL